MLFYYLYFVHGLLKARHGSDARICPMYLAVCFTTSCGHSHRVIKVTTSNQIHCYPRHMYDCKLIYCGWLNGIPCRTYLHLERKCERALYYNANKINIFVSFCVPTFCPTVSGGGGGLPCFSSGSLSLLCLVFAVKAKCHHAKPRQSKHSHQKTLSKFSRIPFATLVFEKF